MTNSDKTDQTKLATAVDREAAKVTRMVPEHLRDYYDPERLSQAMEAAGWSLETEVALYTEIALDKNVQPRTRISAARALRVLTEKVIRDGLLAGILRAPGVRVGYPGTKARAKRKVTVSVTEEGLVDAARRVEEAIDELPSDEEIDDGKANQADDGADEESDGQFRRRPTEDDGAGRVGAGGDPDCGW